MEKLRDGVHKVEKVVPIQSIQNRQACYVKGRCFHTQRGELGEGDKIVVEDGQVEAKITPLPEIDEEELEELVEEE